MTRVFSSHATVFLVPPEYFIAVDTLSEFFEREKIHYLRENCLALVHSVVPFTFLFL